MITDAGVAPDRWLRHLIHGWPLKPDCPRLQGRQVGRQERLLYLGRADDWCVIRRPDIGLLAC